MRNRLFIRYFITSAAIFIFGIFLLGFVLLQFAGVYFRDEKYSLLSQNLDTVKNFTVSDLASNGYQFVDPAQLLPGYSILADAIGARIFLTNPDGVVLISSDSSEYEFIGNPVPAGIVQKAITSDYHESGTLGGLYSSPYYTVASPIFTSDGRTAGVLFGSISAEASVRFRLQMVRMFVFSSLGGMLVVIILNYYTTKRMVTPLNKMLAAAVDFSNGKFSTRVPVTGSDEIAALALALNDMGKALGNLEYMRRSFIANVSHDLKTPMTTIGGFIEGILDGTIPRDRQSYYLEIVANEVRRLSRLVTSLLSVSRIDAGELEIKKVVFDLHETVMTSVFPFEMAIEEKRVQVFGLEHEKVMVYADPDLIHQVVYNLVDNAVKFVDEGGVLAIVYKFQNGKVYCQIRNSGQGIAEDEINNVFERFYKSDKSRSLDKTGVGLGLHIVRQIMLMHGEDIIARSISGQFCEMEFTLPIAQA